MCLRPGEANGEERGHGDQERGEVDQQNTTEAGREQENAGNRRSGHDPDSFVELDEAVGAPQLGLGDDQGDCRHPRRSLEGVADIAYPYQQVDVPEMEAVGEEEEGDEQCRQPGSEVGVEHDLASIPSVDQGSGKRGDDDRRKGEGEGYPGQCGDGSGLLVDPDLEAEAGEHGADHRDQLTAPHDEKGAHGAGGSVFGHGVFGRRGGRYRLGSLCHVDTIMTSY